MKISDFNERLQGFYRNYKEEKDGDITITHDKSDWFWAKITPLPFQQKSPKSEGQQHKNHYEVSILKNHNSNTRHAYLTQLRWRHKLLEIYTPWLEFDNMSCIKGLAKESIGEEHDG